MDSRSIPEDAVGKRRKVSVGNSHTENEFGAQRVDLDKLNKAGETNKLEADSLQEKKKGREIKVSVLKIESDIVSIGLNKLKVPKLNKMQGNSKGVKMKIATSTPLKAAPFVFATKIATTTTNKSDPFKEEEASTELNETSDDYATAKQMDKMGASILPAILSMSEECKKSTNENKTKIQDIEKKVKRLEGKNNPSRMEMIDYQRSFEAAKNTKFLGRAVDEIEARTAIEEILPGLLEKVRLLQNYFTKDDLVHQV